MEGYKHETYSLGIIIQKECIGDNKNLVDYIEGKYLEGKELNAIYLGKYPNKSIGLDFPEGEKDYVCGLIGGEWKVI